MSMIAKQLAGIVATFNKFEVGQILAGENDYGEEVYCKVVRTTTKTVWIHLGWFENGVFEADSNGVYDTEVFQARIKSDDIHAWFFEIREKEPLYPYLFDHTIVFTATRNAQ